MPDLDRSIQITDFRMAGFLVARGCTFAGTTVDQKGDTLFVFKCTPGAPDPQEVLPMYPMSDEWRYDAACRSMHDFVKIQQAKSKHVR